MKSRKVAIGGLILSILLIICSIIFSHGIVLAEEEPTLVDMHIVWEVNGVLLTDNNGDNVYECSFVYTEEDISNKVVAYYYTNDILGKVAMPKIYILCNDEEMSEINSVGEYELSISDAGRQYLNATGQYNIIESTLKFKIEQAEVQPMWDINSILVEDNGKYSFEYNTTDIISYVGLNNSNLFDMSITKDAGEVAEVKDCGIYTFTASLKDTVNYTIADAGTTSVVVEITKAERAIQWKINGQVIDTGELQNNTVLLTYDPDFGANNIEAIYTINNQETSAEVVISNSNGRTFPNVGIYELSYESIDDNVQLSGSGINIEIVKKQIWVVAKSYEIDYVANIPVPSSCYIYSVYEDNNKIELGWSDTNLAFDMYYEDTTPSDIQAVRNDWVYDGINRTKTYTIKIGTKQGVDYSNYDIEYVDGVLDITLKDVSVVFRLDDDNTKQITKTYVQTQVVNTADISEANSFVVSKTTRELSDWYMGENKADFGQKITDNTVFNKYSVYYVYYLNVESEPTKIENGHIINKIPFHKMSPVRYPLADNYMNNGSLPQELYRYEFVMDGWVRDSSNIPMGENEKSSSNISGQDIILCPHYKAISHTINIYNSVTKQNIKYSFTIIDYNQGKEFWLPNQEIEGFQFEGFYNAIGLQKDNLGNLVLDNGEMVYNRLIEIEGDKFKLSDLYERSALEGLEINIIAKYREYKCTVTLVVGDKTITTISQEIGSEINKDYYNSLIDKKFGYIYIMNNVPTTAVGTVVVIRVTELPLLYMILGAGVMVAIIVAITVSIVKKRKNNIDQYKLDVILHNMHDYNLNSDTDENDQS